MVVTYHRPTRAIIHRKALRENIKNEIKRLPKGVELFAVVKADGYGHGAIAAAQMALSVGAAGFCVATLDEAIELREAGITEPILVLSVVFPSYLSLVVDYDLSITVATKEWLVEAQEVLNVLEETTAPIKIHIKADTGMGRIGFVTPEEVKEAADMIEASSNMVWEGLFTHFATADEKDATYWHKQADRFNEVIAALDHLPRYVHSSNSATALWHDKEMPGNMIRYGVGMYGLNPSGHELPESYPLKPAMELVSELIQVKELAAGEGVGYGKTYDTPEKEWIGTIPIGYADGWLRKMQGFSLLVEGEFCEIVGRVCMDQLMIRLPREFKVGTKVTLIGRSKGQEITMQDVADHLGTIHYEVCCMLSERVPRIYQE
ncbi:alanine racemase [Enterococcus hulanensis]|uniref:Alanine racemase n=1 Tax=Enterococcus hulanensis TaxID=2559929 RepID=A0ABU3F0U0_9ENTE|nr:alanine racemase [Enterococcus hulanensis]MDT2600740.1 alanine racemase [Enterococcus hulanensis]MDT2610263.1 alanine racemase [Enterococcus hulanensis]MDT2617329.1 alanine racemase [Enterococcus hulanensis]MDT2628208.1 alanine racemase [Enterococcus hulanensis]MDT2655313.1 alanine racemase [Enterococcus hulanensis]